MKKPTDTTLAISAALPAVHRGTEGTGDFRPHFSGPRHYLWRRLILLLLGQTGRGIVEKQKEHTGWGSDSVVEIVAAFLRRLSGRKGFSPQNIWRRQHTFSVPLLTEFLAKVLGKMQRKANRLPRAKIPKTPERNGFPRAAGPPCERAPAGAPPAARLYYLRATARFGWSRNVLLNQIKAGAYERAVTEKKTHNFPLALPEHLAEQADEMLKSSYNLEFLGIRRAVKERELEDRLISRLQAFLLELGYGFCFVGRQHRLTLGQKEYFIDLLFYHRFLKALVAFELKVGPFEPEHAGKMDFYLNLLNDKERGHGDQPSIGIILCAEKDDVEVEYALRTKANPIGVAAYQLQSKLPADLKGKLPTAKQLADVVRAVLHVKVHVRSGKIGRSDE